MRINGSRLARKIISPDFGQELFTRKYLPGIGCNPEQELAPWAGFDTKTEGDNYPALNYKKSSVFASCNDDTGFTGGIQFHFLYFGSLFDRAEFHFPPK